MNFRLELPPSHPLAEVIKTPRFSEAISSEPTRRELVEYDQLTREVRKGNIFQGLHEGDFWKFKCSYKYQIGEVDQYRFVFLNQGVSEPCERESDVSCSGKRTPAWTDRILYATHTDTPGQSNIKNVLYTSIPSYTTSDHVSGISQQTFARKHADIVLVETNCHAPPPTPFLRKHRTNPKNSNNIPSFIVSANSGSQREPEALHR